jgi:hypothetical protein
MEPKAKAHEWAYIIFSDFENHKLYWNEYKEYSKSNTKEHKLNTLRQQLGLITNSKGQFFRILPLYEPRSRYTL